MHCTGPGTQHINDKVFVLLMTLNCLIKCSLSQGKYTTNTFYHDYNIHCYNSKNKTVNI